MDFLLLMANLIICIETKSLQFFSLKFFWQILALAVAAAAPAT
jgi:hypothetical protein